MKRKFILLPITLTALTPMISMVGCGNNDNGITGDYKKDGEFQQEIEYAPETTPSTDEAANAAYMEGLKKDKNNFVYDYMLCLNLEFKYSEFTENKGSLLVHDFNYEKQTISFDVKADMDEVDGDSLHIDLQYKNLKIEAYKYTFDSNSQITGVQGENGTIISERTDDEPDVWSIIPILEEDNDGKITGSFNNSIIEYDASTAKKAEDDIDLDLASKIIDMYCFFDHYSTFLKKVSPF